jgi:sec-independent protein translocase protein TatA
LALIGYEWLVVVAVILVVFLWGPQKLPELARSIGLAKKEFEKTKTEISSLTSTSSTAPAAEDPLIVAARSIGVPTEGRTREQIAKDIADKTTNKAT